ncbi:MAG TPA: polyprenyl synthetase family protein [Clostridiaceae bacterium]|nr:polyprenyl synthetase family protein [Clostridiaceae bacterium]
MWHKYPEIESELFKVEECIKNSITSRNKLLSHITSDVILSGGKRLRPAILILASKFGNYDSEKTIPAAGALEILHTATLIHDDIIDRAQLRRGKVTVSEKYGMDMAVYTGDFLLTKAVLMLSKSIPGDKLEIAARAVKNICEGEVDQFQDRFNVDISILSYIKRIGRKTAILFAAACAMGAYISGCSDEITRILAKFGMSYGIAFQIRDDINDFFSNEKKSGKPVGSDISKGIITIPIIYALKDITFNKKLLKLLESDNNITQNEVLELAEYIRDCGAENASWKLLRKYVDRGLGLLSKLPDIEARSILEELIKQLDNNYIKDE